MADEVEVEEDATFVSNRLSWTHFLSASRARAGATQAPALAGATAVSRAPGAGSGDGECVPLQAVSVHVKMQVEVEALDSAITLEKGGDFGPEPGQRQQLGQEVTNGEVGGLGETGRPLHFAMTGDTWHTLYTHNQPLLHNVRFSVILLFYYYVYFCLSLALSYISNVFYQLFVSYFSCFYYCFLVIERWDCFCADAARSEAAAYRNTPVARASSGHVRRRLQRYILKKMQKYYKIFIWLLN